jgi:hypothetical protein
MCCSWANYGHLFFLNHAEEDLYVDMLSIKIEIRTNHESMCFIIKILKKDMFVFGLVLWKIEQVYMKNMLHQYSKS